MQTKKRIPIGAGDCLLLAALALPLGLVGLFRLLRADQALMSRWVFGLMAPMEQRFARLWSVFPFSVAEVLTALFLTGCALWLVRAVMLAVRHRAPRLLLRRTAALAAAWLWLWAGLCWLWNAAYYVPSFAQREELEAGPCSVQELFDTTVYFAQQAALLSTQVERDDAGHFAQDLADYFRRGTAVYDQIAQRFPSLDIPAVRAKPLICSPLQSSLGFTGVYFPFTGEANVNIDAPACLVPATIAHEMSHQRMVASEQEANFVAIAACAACDDPVFQYSGYLMGLIHLSNALSPQAPEAWAAIVRQLFTPELSRDWEDNNAYWRARSSPAQDKAGQVYDSFLKDNGQELGLASYGACVDLLVHYFVG